jgi:hypothetical protein
LIAQTSLEAYRAIRPRLGHLQGIIYETISDSPYGLTDRELEKILGWRSSDVVPRRNELANMKLIRQTGTRKNSETGKLAQVWVTT